MGDPAVTNEDKLVAELDQNMDDLLILDYTLALQTLNQLHQPRATAALAIFDMTVPSTPSTVHGSQEEAAAHGVVVQEQDTGTIVKDVMQRILTILSQEVSK